MTPRDKRLHAQLQQDLTALKLTYILEHYSEILDEAARKNTSVLEVLSLLVGGEASAKAERAMQRRMGQARLPKRKTLEDYKFDFPRRIPKQKVLRLFDCEFVERHGCAVLVGGTGTGKSHLIQSVGRSCCALGYRVRYITSAQLLEELTAASGDKTLPARVRYYSRFDLLIIDEFGFDKLERCEYPEIGRAHV